jgi:hypothetical protein
MNMMPMNRLAEAYDPMADTPSASSGKRVCGGTRGRRTATKVSVFAFVNRHVDKQ